MPLVIFSPVAAPMLPPMKAKSRTASTKRCPASMASPQVTASLAPVLARLCSMRFT
jgi:hypothetical protein